MEAKKATLKVNRPSVKQVAFKDLKEGEWFMNAKYEGNEIYYKNSRIALPDRDLAGKSANAVEMEENAGSVVGVTLVYIGMEDMCIRIKVSIEAEII